LDFTFTPEEEKFREEIRDFCLKEQYGESADGLPESGKSLGSFSPGFYRKMIDKGWTGLTLPKEYGGQGRSKIEETIFADEMAFLEAPAPVPALYMVSTFLAKIILKHGSEQLKRRYLPRIARGELWMGQGFTENGAGSDLSMTSTRAVRQGDRYIINGEKLYQSWAHGGEALAKFGINQSVLFLARTDQNAPAKNSLSLFIIEANTPLPGMTVRPIMTVGGIPTNEVFFDNVEIPADGLVGEENHAWDYIVESGAFYWEKRLGYILGTYRLLLNKLIRYVKETQVDGRPLSKNVLVRQKLAKLAMGVERLSLYTYRFAWAYDKGLNIDEAASVYKFQKDQIVNEFINLAMQIFGPYGQLKTGAKDAPLEGVIEAFYNIELIHTFSSCGPNAMINTIAGSSLGLPNEFGLIY
jgi:alkylation response protein AidB-like acyl-CoA dehydrogenase